MRWRVSSHSLWVQGALRTGTDALISCIGPESRVDMHLLCVAAHDAGAVAG